MENKYHIIEFLIFLFSITASAQDNRLYLINRNDSSNVIRVLFDQTLIVKLSDSLHHRGKIISCTDSSIVMTEFYSNEIRKTIKISDIQFLINPYIVNSGFIYHFTIVGLIGLAATPFVYLFTGVEKGNQVLLVVGSLGAIVLTQIYLMNHGETYDLKNDWELHCKNWNTNSMLLPLKQSEIR